MSNPAPKPVEENLARFRFHTGAPITRLAADEVVPILFRDIGFEAMARFLRGELSRLCGPLSPITYLRTADYREPYTDYGRIGRIMLLQPKEVTPWHSGLETIYIAPRQTLVNKSTMVFLPTDIPMPFAAERFQGVAHERDLVEAVGPSLYAGMIDDARIRLDRLVQTHVETERLAAPLREMFQSRDQRQRESAAARLERVGLGEADLCTAWHHLPDERRAFISEALVSQGEVL